MGKFLLFTFFLFALIASKSEARTCAFLFKEEKMTTEAMLLDPQSRAAIRLRGNQNIKEQSFFRLFDFSQKFKKTLTRQKDRELLDFALDFWFKQKKDSEIRLSKFFFIKEISLGNYHRRKEYFLENFLRYYQGALKVRFPEANHQRATEIVHIFFLKAFSSPKL